MIAVVATCRAWLSSAGDRLGNSCATAVSSACSVVPLVISFVISVVIGVVSSMSLSYRFDRRSPLLEPDAGTVGVGSRDQHHLSPMAIPSMTQ
jgi:integral membrane sensor domain MASE1